MAVKKFTNKIIMFALVATLALSAIVLAIFAPVSSAEAAEAVKTSGYFTVKTDGVNTTDNFFENDNLTFDVKSGSTATFDRELAIDKFGFSFDNLDVSGTVKFTFSSASFYANGAETVKDGKTTYEKEIENVLVYKYDGTKSYFKWENETAETEIGSYVATDVINLTIATVDNQLSATVDGVSVTQTDVNKKVKTADLTTAKVSLGFEFADGTVQKFAVVSIDQDTADVTGDHKQTFNITAENKLQKVALPIVKISDGFSVKDASGTFLRYRDWKYELGLTAYSIAPNVVDNSKIEVQEQTGLRLYKSSSYTYMTFSDTFGTSGTDYNEGKVTISYKDASNVALNGKTLREINVKAIDKDVLDVDVDDNGNNGNSAAPVYVTETKTLENFKKQLLENTTAEYDINGVKVTRSIRIGSGKYIDIPSLEGLVKDDYSSYSEMTYTIKYFTPTTTATTTSLKIPVESAGTYKFFVMFKDANNNEMWEKDFVSYDDNGVINGLATRYGSYVFEFTVYDDAPVSMTPSTQETAYVGVEYTATDFNIEASTHTKEYKLFYSKDGVTWGEEITPTSELTEPNQADYPSSGCSNSAYNNAKDLYEYCKKINYNGTLTFTPDEVGYYKIQCTLQTSLETVVSEVVLEVKGKPTVVTPDNHWFEDNILSVVFLIVGSLALVGIILLLVIKPKNKDELTTEPTSKKIKFFKKKKDQPKIEDSVDEEKKDE